MNIPDEILMAFADGELDEATRRTVEAAERGDPEVARRVAEHRALRARLQTAFAPVLDETVPARLLAAVRQAPAARRNSRRPLTVWGSLAASVLVGITAGYVAWHDVDPLLKMAPDGAVTAGGPLAVALSERLSADRKPDQVASIGLSFRAKSGVYCRTFTLSGAAAASGLACRNGRAWRIELLAPHATAPTGGGEYRTAGSADSPQLRSLIDDEMQGEPLSRNDEEAARLAGWAPPQH